MKKLVVLVLLIAGIGYAGSQGFGWYQSQVNTPQSTTSQPELVHVAQGESPEDLAADLHSKGLIASENVFLFYLRYTGARARLQAGDFKLNRDMSMKTIVDQLVGGQTLQLSIQLPEGFTLARMAQSVAQSGVATAQDYLAAAVPEKWSQFDFLAGRPAGAPDTVEGFAFPDTYEVDPSQGATGVLERQLTQFGLEFTPQMRAAAAQPAPGRPAESVWNIVVLASMVEREVGHDPDRAIVCGIYYNRLATGMRLQVDATVLYGLGKWQASLSAADLAGDTPYNTYLHAGLPPGPISNPGAAALHACLSPQPSTYLFYFSDPHGVTHYSSTLAQFDQQQRQFGVAGQ